MLCNHHVSGFRRSQLDMRLSWDELYFQISPFVNVLLLVVAILSRKVFLDFGLQVWGSPETF